MTRTAAVTIAVDETVFVAWELLERSASHHLPGMHPDGRCAGLLDWADVAVACAAPAASLSGASLSGLRVDELLPGHRPALFHAEQTVRHAANLMTYTQAEALPVLDEDGCFAWVLTAADIIAALAGHRRRRNAPTRGRRPRPKCYPGSHLGGATVERRCPDRPPPRRSPR
ncbi:MULTISPECIES: CBS domain-containing protein [Streptomyces]|uniref:CBS domain-containing protein n=1 Tax=Streptomyces TaxID=1883 RepID=UPI001488CE20|nr:MULTISPECIES: CBS domain-containing protein [Streptomyces]